MADGGDGRMMAASKPAIAAAGGMECAQCQQRKDCGLFSGNQLAQGASRRCKSCVMAYAAMPCSVRHVFFRWMRSYVNFWKFLGTNS
eukprot:COSAG06_NODE_3069_length_5895_cov_29.923223_4_plen_87_part_00